VSRPAPNSPPPSCIRKLSERQERLLSAGVTQIDRRSKSQSPLVAMLIKLLTINQPKNFDVKFFETHYTTWEQNIWEIPDHDFAIAVNNCGWL
jgi:hypothetical protein